MLDHELRRERRRSARVPVSASFAELDPRTTTPVANLSRTGVPVVDVPLHPVGARIELRFVVFPEDPRLFVHTGRVVRHVGDPPGMGVEFDPLPPAVDTLLAEILARLAIQRKKQRRRGKRVLLDARDVKTRLLDD